MNLNTSASTEDQLSTETPVHPLKTPYQLKHLHQWEHTLK